MDGEDDLKKIVEDLKVKNKFLQKKNEELEAQLAHKNDIIRNQNQKIYELSVFESKNLHGKELQVNNEVKKKLENIVKKIEENKKKEICVLLEKNKKELKKKAKEVENAKKELKKLKKKAEVSSKKPRKASKSWTAIFRSSGEGLNLNSNALASNALKSGQQKLKYLENDKESLEKKLKKYENINKVLTSTSLLNFTYENDQKAIFVRGYLGFIIKSSLKGEKSRNELKFFEELNGNYLDGVEKCFFKKPLTDAEKEFFPKYYGYWSDQDRLNQEIYKLAIERGESDLLDYVGMNFNKLEEIDRLGLCHDITKALHIFSSRNLIHGDIKPQNILIFPKRKIKLLDFEDVKKVNVREKGMYGTCTYVCPFSGGTQGKFADKREMYSIAGTLLYVCTCISPFQRFLEIIRKHYSCMFGNNELPRLLFSIFVNEDVSNKCYKKLISLKEKEEDVKEFFKFIEIAKQKHSFFPVMCFVDVTSEKKDERTQIFQNYPCLYEVFCNLCSFKLEDRITVGILKSTLKKMIDIDSYNDVKFIELRNSKIKNWSTKQVGEWLDYVAAYTKYQGDFDEIKQKFENINGSKLLNLKEQNLIDMEITQIAVRKKLLDQIHHFIGKNKDKWFDSYVVYKKLQKMAKYKYQKSDFEFLSRSLSDVEYMKETYLSLETAEDEIMKRIENTEDSKKEEKEDKEYITKRYGCIEKEDLPLTQLRKFPVKLVITDLKLSEGSKNIRKILSPVVKRIPKLQQQFGIFHTAVIVGPWYIEWGNNELVIPRRVKSGMAIFSADVNTLNLINNSIEEIVDLLAKCIVKWNTKMRYSRFEKKGHGNCQNFVEDLLESLSMPLNINGAMWEFLEAIKTSGRSDMFFKPNEEFKNVFELKKEKYVFNTHKELDKFVHGLNLVILRMDYKEEYNLLKSFDRAFWLRHFADEKNELYEPSENCPFRNPIDTQSYMSPPNKAQSSTFQY